MKEFGLIGKTLSHSFSKTYFTEKFNKEGLTDCSYDLFELEEINEVDEIFNLSHLKGFNVTIPYKVEILPYLDRIDPLAKRIGAVNVVKVGTERIGYNSDYFGFRKSIENWIPFDLPTHALILGNGGASQAVKIVLQDLGITYKIISRSSGDYSYDQLETNPELVKSSKLIINTTPLGMYPFVQASPKIDYSLISEQHYLFDLIYNPIKTTFLTMGEEMGAKIKNGEEMLVLQAEKSWEIWNS